MTNMRTGMDDRLDALFAEYARACSDVDAGPDFMPKLWQRIESRRLETFSLFRRLAQVCVMATLALALIMGVIIPQFQSDLDGGHYADVLAAEQAGNYAQILAGDL